MHGFTPIISAVGAFFILAGAAPAAIVTIDGGMPQPLDASAAIPAAPGDELAGIVVGTRAPGARQPTRPEAVRSQISERPGAADRSDPIPAASDAPVASTVAPSFVQQLQQWLDFKR